MGQLFRQICMTVIWGKNLDVIWTDLQDRCLERIVAESFVLIFWTVV